MTNRQGIVGTSTLVATAALLWIAALLTTLPAQTQGQMTTTERIEGARWWPTKATSPRGDYVGAAVCAECHQTKAESQARTAMARTATRAAESDVLSARKSLTLKAAGYFHEITTENGSSVYSVSDGNRTASAVLRWAFGAGKVGQTFLFEREGTIHESRVSYFGTLNALDLTPGRSADKPGTMDAALGRPLSSAEMRRCFSCHTTGFSIRAGSSLAELIPGVTCEACHGPGRAHSEAMRQHRDSEGLAAIVNPAPFSPTDSVDFCGACHATYWDVTLAGEKGLRAMRSQPFRLQSSRCWGEGDRRITCVACHSPHELLERDPRFYDRRCLNCHKEADSRSEPAAVSISAISPDAPACKTRARAQCTSCHMPKYEVPEMHFSFTDHLIRVVRPNSDGIRKFATPGFQPPR